MEVNFEHNNHSKNRLKEVSAIQKRNTQFEDDFSKEVFELTYKYENENDINDRHLAIAKDLASVEKPELQKYWTKKFLDILEDFKFVPGGRITSNAGTGLKGTTYINCFVSGFRGENQDSMESIMDELRRQALILKSEGGYGFCADVMRPRGAYVGGIGGDSPGSVKLLEMWDTQSSVITAGSGGDWRRVPFPRYDQGRPGISRSRPGFHYVDHIDHSSTGRTYAIAESTGAWSVWSSERRLPLAASVDSLAFRATMIWRSLFSSATASSSSTAMRAVSALRRSSAYIFFSRRFSSSSSFRRFTIDASIPPNFARHL